MQDLPDAVCDLDRFAVPVNHLVGFQLRMTENGGDDLQSVAAHKAIALFDDGNAVFTGEHNMVYCPTVVCGNIPVGLIWTRKRWG